MKAIEGGAMRGKQWTTPLYTAKQKVRENTSLYHRIWELWQNFDLLNVETSRVLQPHR